MANVDTFDPDADRDEREAQLEVFARSGEGAAPRRDMMIPQQLFSAAGERVIGAQEVAVHRNEATVLAKLKALAAAAGEDWYYRYPVENKKLNRKDWIEGPSIKLANDLARIYGNCDVDIRVQDLGDSWLFYARFTDYETGFSLTRPFQARKSAGKIGGADDARRLDIAFQIGVSKAERNVVVNGLQTFADFAFEEARQAIVDKVGKNIAAYRDKVLLRLTEAGIDKARVERSVGRVAGEWLAPDIARIIATIKAVADGMATWDESFPPLTPQPGGGGDGKPAGEEQAAEVKPGLDQFAEAGEGAAAGNRPAAESGGGGGDGADRSDASAAAATPRTATAADAKPAADARPAKGGKPAAKPDSEAASMPAATEAAAGAAATSEAIPPKDARDPAAVPRLTAADKVTLRKYSDNLGNALQEKTLSRGSSSFLEDHKVHDGTAAGAAAELIYKAHVARVKGESSPADVDNEVRRLLS